MTDVVTFGCRLNTLDSEAVRSAAAAAGEDVVVFNTCAVTGEAVRQARQSIRRVARARPQARIVVTGCAAQAQPETFAHMPEVHHVLGEDLKTDASAWAALNSGGRVQIPAERRRDPLPARGAVADGRTRAFVQVQSGCDHACTFCIIPLGRGPSRSAPAQAVVERVRALTAQGAKEVVLTGVDLTSWGEDFDGQLRLGGLVRRILDEVPELPRLRLSSLDCIEVDADLLHALAEEPRLMPHLHLSLQAGDDLVLKRMKRRHLREQAIGLCARIRALRPDVVFGADLIAGFPTEDEAMFARSLDLVEACGLVHLHVFPFSARPGTPAARMPQVPGEVARERAARLRTAGEAALGRHLQAQVGRRLQVLTERGGQGRAEDFSLVRLPGIEPGRLLDVVASSQDGRALVGDFLSGKD